MAEIVIRPWQPPDLPRLREIFAAVYGDPPEITEAFFRTFLAGPESCIVAAAPEEGIPEGRPVAAVYCLPGPVLHFSGEKQADSEYWYALGCLPSWRGRGIGMKLYTFLFSGNRAGEPVHCMIPASAGLAGKYAQISPVRPLGRIRSAVISREQLAASPLAASPLAPEEYARRREAALAPYPHAEYPASWLNLMAEYGNVFLALPGALAAVIPLEDRCAVAELLCTGADPAQALSGVAAACPAARYEVRTPAFLPGPGAFRPFAYENGVAEAPPEDFWFPFGLE